MVTQDAFSEASRARWIEYYNKLIEREAAASAWMADPKISQEQREAEFLRYKCEVLEPINSYVQFFAAIGIEAEPFRKVVQP